MGDSSRRGRPRIPLPPAAELLDMVKDGLTYAAIAERFDCSPNTIGYRLKVSGVLDRHRAAARQAANAVLDVQPPGPGESWRERALCAETDPEIFYPEKGGSTREAKRLCQRCEVRDDCLRYALDRDERFGIWGGLSERERHKLKRRPA